MPTSAADKMIKYRANKKAALGDEYKRQENLKRKLRRQRAKVKAEEEEAEVKSKVSITPAERTMAWRQKQEAELGKDAFRRKESAARKERRRKSAKEQKDQDLEEVTAMMEEVKIQPAPKVPDKKCELLLDQVYQSKLRLLKKKGKPPIKRESVAQQLVRVVNLYKKMTGEISDCTDFDWTKDTKKVIKFISTHWEKPNSKCTQLQALSSILIAIPGFEDAYDTYSSVSSALRKKITTKDNDNLLTKSEQKNYVPWTKIASILSKVKNPRDRSLIGLYTLAAPRRANDVSLLRLSTKSDDEDQSSNWLDITGKKAIVKYNVYKTAKTIGKIAVRLHPSLSDILKDYVEKANLQHGDYIFPTKHGQSYHNFSEIVSRTFAKYYKQKKITVNSIRHSYITHFLSEPRSVADKEAAALAMGHSVSMQSKYLRLPDSDSD